MTDAVVIYSADGSSAGTYSGGEPNQIKYAVSWRPDLTAIADGNVHLLVRFAGTAEGASDDQWSAPGEFDPDRHFPPAYPCGWALSIGGTDIGNAGDDVVDSGVTLFSDIRTNQQFNEAWFGQWEWVETGIGEHGTEWTDEGRVFTIPKPSAGEAIRIFIYGPANVYEYGVELPGRTDVVHIRFEISGPSADGGGGGGGDSLVAPPPPMPRTGESETGVDIACITDVGTSLSLARGPRNIGNALARRLITPRGGLFYDPNYGLDIRNYLNAGFTPQALAQVQADVASEVSKDPRVENPTVTVVQNLPAARMDITISCELAEGPYEFVFGVSSLTVDLLKAQALA